MYKRLIVACCLAAAAAHSMAQLRIEHVGAPALHEAVATNVDMSADLTTAAKAIFPPGWNGFAAQGLDVRRASRVSLRAGDQWLAALERWLAAEGLVARIDWGVRNFYLRPAGVAGAGQAAAVAAAGNAGAASTQPGEPVRQWTVLATDVRLEATLERWAKDAGYRLVWDAERHVLISAGDQFSGTLAQALGRVLSSPAIRDSDYPLEAVIYANTPPVIRITRLGDQAPKE